jgi:hypothetical protein
MTLHFSKRAEVVDQGRSNRSRLVVLAAKAGLGQDETRQQFPRIGNFLSARTERE